MLLIFLFCLNLSFCKGGFHQHSMPAGSDLQSLLGLWGSALTSFGGGADEIKANDCKTSQDLKSCKHQEGDGGMV